MKNKFLKLMALFVASAFAVNVGAQTNGTYYLYNEASGLFLSRGGTWGTHAVVADYGISFEIVNKNSNVYTLKNIDHSLVFNGGKYLGPDIYTDQGSQDYSFTASGDGYVLAKGADYLKINEPNQYGQKEIGTTGTVSDAAVWELLSKEQYEVKVLERRNANVASIAQKVGLSVATEEELIAELSEWVSQDYTSKIGNADIGGGSAAWNINPTDANRGIGNPKSASGTFEVWKACADVNQTIEGLPQGIYKISVQAFYRHGAAANAVRVGDNYNMVVNLYANGNSTRLVSWNTIRTNNTYPNNQGDAHALLDSNASLALVEVFAYVGADGKLTLGIDNSSYVDDDWMICDNFKLTYYENIKDELKSEIEKLIDEARNIEATYGVDAKVVLDKAVADGNAALESFTVGSLTAAIEPLKAAVARAKRSVAINAAAMGATQGTPVDFTEFVANPDMANGTINGWTVTSGWKFQQNSTYEGDGAELNKFQERWNNGTALGNTSSMQELLDMPNGVYRISADVLATAQYNADSEGHTTGAYLVANDVKIAVATPNEKPEKYELQVTVMDGTLTIGVKGENTTANWLAFDNVMVYYYGVDLTAFIYKYNDALGLAKSYLGKLFEEDETKLEQAITENTLDPSNATEAELIVATKNLESAIREAAPASVAYTTYTSASELLANAGNVAEVDFTSLLINPGFEAGDVRGWTNSGVLEAGAQGNNSFDNKKGDYYAEKWRAAGTVDLNQTVAGLPAGIYKLSAYVFSDTNDAKLYANEKEKGFSTSGLDSVLVEIGDKGAIKFGASCTLTNSTWICMDGFTLSYMNDLTYTLAEGKMSVAADNAQKEAAAAFQAEKTLANYDAVLAAIRAAEASVESYKVAKTAIDKANSILSANNFVTGAAYATFEEAITGIAGSYYNGSLSDADAKNAGSTLGTSISGWRANANGAAGVYMVSAWGIPTDNWDGAHVNTWSTEGEADGSNFVVPFIEYWVDAGSLPAKTMTATLEGLAAGKSYKVTMDVRVKGSAVANKVTLTVGGGAPVDVAKGNQIGTADLYLGTFTAYGKADENGRLIAIVDVAAESGISWVAWQNTKYEEMALDFSALSVAIANAEAVNARISGGVKVLSDAIAIAKDVYSSATVQEELDDAVESLLAVTFEAEATVVARKYLAGVAKKAAALKSFLDVNIDDEIATAVEYAANAEATATEADAKADAINAYFSAWKVVALNNANFDTDINISKDGTVNAEIISPATKDKPYIYPVTGWTPAFTFKATASQGTTAAYGAIVPANKGTNGTNPPAEDMFGKSEGGVLHLSSGWSDQARYNQKVTLPAGKYVLYYEGYNANNTPNKLNSNYFGIGGLTEGDLEGTKNTFKYSDEKSFAYGEWKATAFDFTLTKNVADAVLNVGIIGGTAGSGATPKMWFDNVTIYCIAESATMNISDAKYSTFIAPFDVEIPEGITASKITGVEGNVLTEEAVEGTIPANTPVVLYSETPVSKTFYGQNIATAETYTAGLLTGVYNDTKVATGNYVLLRKKTTGHVGFYLVGETLPTIKANSCYLTVPASSAPMFSFGRGEGATGIEDAELTNDNVVIYDLAGRRVEKMEKGIYIVNGRKVIR